MSTNSRLENHILGGHLWHASCKQNVDYHNVEQQLPICFDSVQQYQNTFCPLLIEEAIEGVRSGFLEAVDAKKHTQIQFERFQATDQSNWYEASLTLINKQNGHSNQSKKYSLKEGQIATIVNANPADSNVRKFVRTGEWQLPVNYHSKRKRDDQQHSKQQIYKSSGVKGTTQNDPIFMLSGIVKRCNDPTTLIISFRLGCNKHLPTNHDSPCRKVIDVIAARMRNKQNWWVVPCGNFITQQREIDALQRIGNMPVSPFVLNPQLLACKVEDLSNTWPVQASSPGFLNYLRSQYDIPQLEAIEICAAHLAHPCKVGKEKKVFPFVLIQGPPGTGKTHTVKGILNTWHAALFNQYYDALGVYMRDEASKRRLNVMPIDGSVSDVDVVGDILDHMEDSIWGKHPELQNEDLVKPRVLVCAPSNAATDELVERITKDGFMGMDGNKYFPNIARVGSEEAPLSSEAKRVWTEQRVQALLNTPLQEIELQFRTINSKIRDRYAQIQFAQRQLIHDSGQNTEELIRQIISEKERLDANEMQLRRLHIVLDLYRPGNDTNGALRRARDNLESTYLEEAQIVFTTLSSTGRSAFYSQQLPSYKFQTVLIDEACQAQEVSAIQPLIFGCKRCVLVGDPQQLPATVLSQRSKKAKLDRSLFERLMQGGCPVKLLQVQYRMHPEIRQFPSQYFYQNKLIDGNEVVRRSVKNPAKFYHHQLLKPYIVFDVDCGKERRIGSSGSLRNEQEAEMALALFWELRNYLIKLKSEGETVEKCEVGIITPYREQRTCIQEVFQRYLGPNVSREVKIETIDSFQGKQMDVVIFSCVRAGGSSGGSVNSQNSQNNNCVGFLQDIRRMNVAITRAKQAMWILGNLTTLKNDDNWRALVEDAEERQVVISNANARELFKDLDIWEKDQQNFLQKDQDDSKTETKDVSSNKFGGNTNDHQYSNVSSNYDGQQKNQNQRRLLQQSQRNFKNRHLKVNGKIGSIGHRHGGSRKQQQFQHRGKQHNQKRHQWHSQQRQNQQYINQLQDSLDAQYDEKIQVQQASEDKVENQKDSEDSYQQIYGYKEEEFLEAQNKRQKVEPPQDNLQEYPRSTRDPRQRGQNSTKSQTINSNSNSYNQHSQQQLQQINCQYLNNESTPTPQSSLYASFSSDTQTQREIDTELQSTSETPSTLNKIHNQNIFQENGDGTGGVTITPTATPADPSPAQMQQLQQRSMYYRDVEYGRIGGHSESAQQQQCSNYVSARDPRQQFLERQQNNSNINLLQGSGIEGQRFEAMSIDEAWVTAFNKAS